MCFNRAFSHYCDTIQSGELYFKRVARDNDKTDVPVAFNEHDVAAAILVYQNNKTAAMLVYQANLVGFVLFSCVNTFFGSNKFA